MKLTQHYISVLPEFNPESGTLLFLKIMEFDIDRQIAAVKCLLMESARSAVVHVKSEILDDLIHHGWR